MLACKYAVLETRWPRVRKEADPVSTSGCATIALASRHVVCDPPTAAAPLSAPQFGPCDFESWMRTEADTVSTSGCATLAFASRLMARDPPTVAAPLSARWKRRSFLYASVRR